MADEDEEEDIIDYMADKAVYYKKKEAEVPLINRILSKLTYSSSTPNVKIMFLTTLVEELSRSPIEEEQEILQKYLDKLS